MSATTRDGCIARVLTLVATSLALLGADAQAQNVGVFASQRLTTGNIGGLAGADAICQAEGSQRFPAFAGPWRAWLSDSATDASVRVAQPGVGGAYVRASDGTTVIANDLAALVNTSRIALTNAIDPVFAVVWTGTGANGLRLGTVGGSSPAEFCEDWRSSEAAAAGTGLPRAWIGNSDQTSKRWTENGLGECQYAVPIFCFGQEFRGDALVIPPLELTVSDFVDLTEAPNPEPEWFVRPTGTIKALMVFVDFDDAVGDPSPRVIAAAARRLLGDGAAQRFFREQSNGKVSLDVKVSRRGWMRMRDARTGASRTVDYYTFESAPDLWSIDYREATHGDFTTTKLYEYIRDCMGLFDSINFDDYDVLMIVPPATARMTLSPAHIYHEVTSPHQGKGSIRSIVTFGQDSSLNRWTNLVHELGHLLGLPDLYGSLPDPDPTLDSDGDGDPTNDRVAASGAKYWALMDDIFHGSGFIGWHRYKLGWLNPSQTRYLRSGMLTATLQQHSTTKGVSMIVVPARDGNRNVLPNKVFVIEVAQPYYPENSSLVPGDALGDDGWAWATIPEPAGKGVLIYSVDANIPTQEFPIKILGKEGDSPWETEGPALGAPWLVNDTFSRSDAPMSVAVEEKIGDSFRVTVTVK